MTFAMLILCYFICNYFTDMSGLTILISQAMVHQTLLSGIFDHFEPQTIAFCFRKYSYLCKACPQAFSKIKLTGHKFALFGWEDYTIHLQLWFKYAVSRCSGRFTHLQTLCSVVPRHVFLHMAQAERLARGFVFYDLRSRPKCSSNPLHQPKTIRLPSKNQGQIMQYPHQSSQLHLGIFLVSLRCLFQIQLDEQTFLCRHVFNNLSS